MFVSDTHLPQLLAAELPEQFATATGGHPR